VVERIRRLSVFVQSPLEVVPQTWPTVVLHRDESVFRQADAKRDKFRGWATELRRLRPHETDNLNFARFRSLSIQSSIFGIMWIASG